MYISSQTEIVSYQQEFSLPRKPTPALAPAKATGKIRLTLWPWKWTYKQ